MILLHRLWNDSRGATAAEYAMILGIVGAAIAVSAAVLAMAIGTEMNEAADCISNSGSC